MYCKKYRQFFYMAVPRFHGAGALGRNSKQASEKLYAPEISLDKSPKTCKNCLIFKVVANFLCNFFRILRAFRRTVCDKIVSHHSLLATGGGVTITARCFSVKLCHAFPSDQLAR